LLIPHIRRLAAAIGGFGHLLQYRKAFITASALEQKLGQRRLQLRIPGLLALIFFSWLMAAPRRAGSFATTFQYSVATSPPGGLPSNSLS
jgi:hypothetical protein